MKEKCNIDILGLIAYFEIFEYPLRLEDIDRFLPSDKDEIKKSLLELVQLQIISELNEYYGIGELKYKIERREKGNLRAQKLHDRANKNAKFISKFPFVSGVMISGSFSKGFVSDEGDIDFFIITKPGRLWIARTMLIVYKKLFLFNSHEYFCVNYFVDENHLEIEEKNIFTATELVTLMPMVNSRIYELLIKKNRWIRDYFPSSTLLEKSIIQPQNPLLKRVFEKSLSNRLGIWLDTKLMKITLKKWQRKFHFLSSADFEIAMKTTTNISKHHPNNFQKKVLNRHERILSELMIQLGKKVNVQTTI